MLSAFIVYLSLFLGKILRLITPEEVRQYKKYLDLTKNPVLILISISFIYLSLSPFLLTLVPSFLLFRYLKIPYFILGLATFLSFSTSLSILPLSLILIFTLIYSSLEPWKVKPFIKDSLLFILPFTLVAIETFINANSEIFIGIVIGGLLSLIERK